jgi:hypothetical protein
MLQNVLGDSKNSNKFYKVHEGNKNLEKLQDGSRKKALQSSSGITKLLEGC